MMRLILKILWTQSLLILWLGLLLTIAGSWAYYKRDIVKTYFDSRDVRNQTRAEVEALRKDVTRQNEGHNSTSKEVFLMEKSAREIYHMSKPGEKVLYLDMPGDALSTATLKKSVE